MFLFFAFAGTQIANLNANSPTPGTSSGAADVNTSNLMFIALAFGFSLMVNVWIFFRISGGLFNPAISLALALVKIITPLRAALLVVAQILGGISAAALVNVLLPQSLFVRTQLGGGISTVQGIISQYILTLGLFLEMFMTAELVFVVFMLAAEKHKATFLAPVGIGIAMFMAEMAGVYYTGGSLNPARSFGPDVVLHSFDSYHWIYCTHL
jgi:aquaporin related protein